eukprot:13456559-Ditylum_brightwellii.AAC.1
MKSFALATLYIVHGDLSKTGATNQASLSCIGQGKTILDEGYEQRSSKSPVFHVFNGFTHVSKIIFLDEI